MASHSTNAMTETYKQMKKAADPIENQKAKLTPRNTEGFKIGIEPIEPKETGTRYRVIGRKANKGARVKHQMEIMKTLKRRQSERQRHGDLTSPKRDM